MNRHQRKKRKKSLPLAMLLSFIAGWSTWWLIQKNPDFRIGNTIVSLETFPGKVVELSNIDHGDDIVEVLEGIRQEDFEVITAFTEDGEKIFEYTDYDKTSVFLSDVHLRLLRDHDNVILAHNHPVEEAAAFSKGDLATLICAQATYGMVVTKTHNHVVFPRGEWPKAEKVAKYIDKHADFATYICHPSDPEKLIPVTTKPLMTRIADKYDLAYYEWPNWEVSSAEIIGAIRGE